MLRTTVTLALAVAIAAAALIVSPANAGQKTIAATLAGHNLCDSRGGMGVYGRNGNYTYYNAAGEPAKGGWNQTGDNGVHVYTTRGQLDLVFNLASDGTFNVGGTAGSFTAHFCSSQHSSE